MLAPFIDLIIHPIWLNKYKNEITAKIIPATLIGISLEFLNCKEIANRVGVNSQL